MTQRMLFNEFMFYIKYPPSLKLKLIIFLYFQLRTDFNDLLMNLIIAELILAGYGVPVNFTNSLLYGWKLGKNMCLLHGFFLTLSGK